MGDWDVAGVSPAPAASDEWKVVSVEKRPPSQSSYEKYKAQSEVAGGPDMFSAPIRAAVDSIGQAVSPENIEGGKVFSILPKAPIDLAKGVGALAAAPFATIAEGAAKLGSKATGGFLSPEQVGTALSAISPARGSVPAASRALPAAQRVEAEIAGGAPAISKAPAPTADALNEAATAAYQSPEVKDLALKPDPVRNWSQEIRAKLNAEGFDDIGSPKTFRRLANLENAPEGAKVTGDNLNSLRKSLGKAAGSPDAEERAAASMAIKSLDEFLPRLAKQDVLSGDATAAASKFEEARGNYAAMKRSEDVIGRAENAQTSAKAANSGQNVENATRQQFARILKSDKLKRGYSADELAQMETIVKRSPIGNAIRGAGNLLGGGGGMHGFNAAAIGGYATGGPGALAPVFGYALKKLGTRLTVGEVAKLDEMVRARSPLGRAIGASTKVWSEAGQAFEASPSTKTFVGLNLASRNLSNTLSGAGIKTSVDDLLRSLQGPVPTGASDEQPKPEGVVNQ